MHAHTYTHTYDHCFYTNTLCNVPVVLIWVVIVVISLQVIVPMILVDLEGMKLVSTDVIVSMILVDPEGMKLVSTGFCSAYK